MGMSDGLRLCFQLALAAEYNGVFVVTFVVNMKT